MDEILKGICGGPCMCRPPTPDSRADMLGDLFGVCLYDAADCFPEFAERDALAECELGFMGFFRLDVVREEPATGPGV